VRNSVDFGAVSNTAANLQSCTFLASTTNRLFFQEGQEQILNIN